MIGRVKPRIAATVLSLLLSVHSGIAAAQEHSPLSYANMPPGWVWPPSKAMLHSGERCLAELAATGTEAQVVARVVGKIATPVVVPSMTFGGIRVRPVHRGRLPVMDCHMALSLVREGPVLAAAGIRALIVGRFHSDRRARLGGRSLNIMSRHALGLGVDILGFKTRDGQRLTVEQHYRHPVVQAVEAALNAHGAFRATITPGNDRAHRNHFHLSAKMTIDESHPDETTSVAQLLEAVRPKRRARKPGRRALRKRKSRA